MGAGQVLLSRPPHRRCDDRSSLALPTAVAGITLTSLYAPNGWFGQYLEPYGIQGVFSPLGITIALIFIGLPFVVRTLQPVIADLDVELEEVATSLNMPMKTEIASLLIITKLTQYDYVGAAAIAFVLLLLSFVLLLVLNGLQGWSAKRLGY